MKYFSWMKAIGFTVALLAIHITSCSSHDEYYRTLFCNPSNDKEELKELPAHFLNACKNAGIDPQSIHVYKTKKGWMYTVGRNIMLAEEWFTDHFYKTEEEQAWGFAHELSHVYHDDTEKGISYISRLYDFQMGSSFLAAVYGLQKLYRQKLSIASAMRVGGLWALSNIGVLYAYYQAKQACELRANEDAARWTTPEAGISVLEKIEWSQQIADNFKGRLDWHIERFGFCVHGSPGLQIARLRKLQQENAHTIKK